jgi:hypothetical protein
MAEFVELSMDDLEQVTGGRTTTVNTGTDQNAAIRNAPGNGDIIASLKNDTPVDTVGTPVYDPGTDRNWIMVKFKQKGKIRTGWVAASIVGLKRK